MPDKNAKSEKLPMKREFSSGGVVYKKARIENSEFRIQWLIGKHSGYQKWVLPKGLIEPGEKGIETAVRETEEEMGVVAKVIGEKPIYKEEYWFVATLKSGEQQETSNKKQDKKPIRRVKVYQEDPGFEESTEEKVRVLKTVTFYLMEYVSGDPKDHDWEMSDAKWVDYDEAMGLLAFPGEKKALERARGSLIDSA